MRQVTGFVRRPERWNLRRWTLLVVAVLAVSFSWTSRADGQARTRRNTPSIGYVYPAGGQVGTTLVVTVGGQFLRGAKSVHVSGEGVNASIALYAAPSRQLDRNQIQKLRRQLVELRDRKLGIPPGKPQKNRPGAKGQKGAQASEPVKIPPHPLLEDLESKSVEELYFIARYFFQRKNPLQRKRAIEELARIEVTIAPDAEPGMRELRISSQNGLTNPLRFRVGLLPEVRESPLQGQVLPMRANDAVAGALIEQLPIDLPAVLNGQILPRDVDRFRLRAKKGQRLVLRAEARALIPYQADSVPGWMQTTLALFDDSGKEVAYADEYRFDPDPVLFCEIPRDGVYTLEVRDAIARGREDFVYRVEAGELPFITRVFPLGGRAGEKLTASIEGWNLERDEVELDTEGDARGVRQAAWRHGDARTNDVRYAVDTLPEDVEVEPNDDRERASRLAFPTIVNGRIGEPGDRDVFRFEGKDGDQVVVEVLARTLGSPLDSLLRLLDAEGQIVAWNDDREPADLGVRGLGLQTHAADSYLLATLPRAGAYFVQLADSRNHGGQEYAYRLRVSAPRPDFELFMSPSSISVAAGRATEIRLYAVRKDGFDGAVKIDVQGGPDGFTLGGARIPPGRDRVRMTLGVPLQSPTPVVSLRLRGRARIGDGPMVRPVKPADDVMQAFLWRHLVPSDELAVSVVGKGNRWTPVVALANDKPVRIRTGGKGSVPFAVTTGKIDPRFFQFVMVDPPKGVTLGAAKPIEGGFTLEIRASADAEPMAHPDNLIVEVFGKPRAAQKKKGQKGAKPKARRPYSVGVLPAVPFVVKAR